MQATEIPDPSNDALRVAYSRAAYRALTRLDALRRLKVMRLVNGIAANATQALQRRVSPSAPMQMLDCASFFCRVPVRSPYWR